MTEAFKRRWTLTDDKEAKVIHGWIRVRGYKHCDVVVRPYAQCVKENPFQPWKCEANLRRMKECLHTYFEEYSAEIEEDFLSKTPQEKAEIKAYVKKKKG
eukprot:TRINITY_DN11554_c0_g1_i1.p1 TRINITY_DN11554_c0_g1~~TRINITY_DN11554_c0_g1_i1.p1  ORF type:complete len:100 (-),score=20.01 TRINITY_DN11554_c0_g1_i1:29-328(-)